ncbi:MAG: PRC-barrel domain-containing protein [Nanoarchaeota archaeon]
MVLTSILDYIENLGRNLNRNDLLNKDVYNSDGVFLGNVERVFLATDGHSIRIENNEEIGEIIDYKELNSYFLDI